MRRDVRDGVEFVLVSFYDAIADAVRACAGGANEIALVPPTARALLVVRGGTHGDIGHAWGGHHLRERVAWPRWCGLPMRRGSIWPFFLHQTRSK